MATLAQNINNTIAYLNDIRDAIINTGIGMPINTPVSEYADWISQLEFKLILEISQDSFNFKNDGIEKQQFDLTCNSNWVINTFPSWITVDKTSGHGDDVIEVSCAYNTTLESRSGTITITSNNLNKVINITQEAQTRGICNIHFRSDFNVQAGIRVVGELFLISNHKVETSILFDLINDGAPVDSSPYLLTDTWSINRIEYQVLRNESPIDSQWIADPPVIHIGNETSTEMYITFTDP